MRMRYLGCRVPAIIAALSIALWSREASAQSRVGLGVIDGTVSDTNLVVLSDATASILGSTVHVTTGGNGRFRIQGLHAGEYLLVVHRLGFKPMSASVVIAGADTLRMSFTLERIATVLDTVSVIGERYTARMSQFELRRKAGFGHFLTVDDIDKRHAVQFADLIRAIPSVEVIDNGFSQVAANMRGMTSLLGGGCAFQLFVDDVPLSTINLRDL
ncbi:MAG: carboxypeptidase regulatory-like domain-containing protein [Gemmatimonadaceae bacterium]